MIRATIQTELDNRQFAPREEIQGQVGWEGIAAGGDAELRLFYYTSGKGTRDAVVVETRAWPAVGSAGAQEFSFTLPEGPFSFSGKLVSLQWALEFILAADGHSERLELVVSPTGHDLDLYRYPLPPGVDSPARRKSRFSLRKP